MYSHIMSILQSFTALRPKYSYFIVPCVFDRKQAMAREAHTTLLMNRMGGVHGIGLDMTLLETDVEKQ